MVLDQPRPLCERWKMVEKMEQNNWERYITEKTAKYIMEKTVTKTLNIKRIIFRIYDRFAKSQHFIIVFGIDGRKDINQPKLK